MIAAEAAYPPLVSGETIFAVGDIHGRVDLLDALHSQIDEAAAKLSGAVIEVYLGDYVDRGPDSAGVVRRLIQRERSRNLVLMRGNHEILFAQALEGALELREWARFGGLQTLQSYGVEAADWRNGGDWRGRLRARIPAEHIRFLRTLFDWCWRGDYFFAHAGVRPGVPLQEQAPEDLGWIRADFLDDERDHGAIVVHGHTPVATPELRRNRINLDTGAFVTGRLSCLRIDGDGARLFGGGAETALPARLLPSRLARLHKLGAALRRGWRPIRPAAAQARGA